MNAKTDVTLPALDHQQLSVLCKALSNGHILNGKEFDFSARLPLHTDSTVREALEPGKTI